MVAPRVYEAMGQPIVGHLDPYFFEIAEDVRRLLGYVFSTQAQFNIAISGTGTSGMEAAVANFAEPGKIFASMRQRLLRRSNFRKSQTATAPTRGATRKALG